MRFLVAGCGSIGQRHIANLLELGMASVVAYDPSPASRGQTLERFAIETTDDFASALDACDVLLVTAPTSLHVPLALEGARLGKHLFVEKPLGNTTDQLAELLGEVEKQELVTLVGCNMRFHPGLQALKQLLDEGAVGRVLSARIEVGQYLPDWRPAQDYRETYSAKRDLGGGIIFDAIHELDYCRWLLGEIVEVSCLAVNTGALEIETEDLAAILARLASGAIAEIHLDYLSRPPLRSCRVTGTEGAVEWDFYATRTRIQRIGTDTWDTVWMNGGWSANDMYLDELRHFLACIAGTEQSTLDVRNAAAVLAIALAAHESASSQQAVVPSRP